MAGVVGAGVTGMRFDGVAGRSGRRVDLCSFASVLPALLTRNRHLEFRRSGF